MDIVGRARKLERKLTRSLDAAVVELVGSAAAPAPLEIVHAVLDRIEQEVQEGGRGQRVFPFNRVKVLVVAPSRDAAGRARFSAVADGPPALADRVRARLEAAGCRSVDVSVGIAFVAKPGAQWESRDYHVEFSREPATPAAAPQPTAVPRLKLAIATGKAAHRFYEFTGGRIDMGRRSEVIDAKQRVVRTNQVAFDDEGPDANRSVSRRHAHVIYHEPGSEYRLLDDRSVHGTSIVRKGRTIAVPAGSRGVRLETGDEILLGQARIRVRIDS